MPDNDSPNRPDLDSYVAAARTDEAAFGKLYEAYYERILVYCMRRLNQKTAAEDACGETFLFVARKLASFPGNTEDDFRRWIYRIATNEVNAHLRRSIRRQQLWNEAIRENRLKAVETHEICDVEDSTVWQAVHRAMSRLTPKEQSVLTLRLMEELSHDEIARILRIRAGTVRVIYSRAIKRLRNWLKPDAHDSPLR